MDRKRGITVLLGGRYERATLQECDERDNLRSQFHQYFTSGFFVQMLNMTYNVHTKKLQLMHLYEKAARIMLVKLTPVTLISTQSAEGCD